MSAAPHLKEASVNALGIQHHVVLATCSVRLQTGTERPESDLDLAIDVGHALTVSEKMALIAELPG